MGRCQNVYGKHGIFFFLLSFIFLAINNKIGHISTLFHHSV